MSCRAHLLQDGSQTRVPARQFPAATDSARAARSFRWATSISSLELSPSVTARRRPAATTRKKAAARSSATSKSPRNAPMSTASANARTASSSPCIPTPATTASAAASRWPPRQSALTSRAAVPTPLPQQVHRPQRARQTARLGASPQRGQRLDADDIGELDERRKFDIDLAVRVAAGRQDGARRARRDLARQRLRVTAVGIDHRCQVGVTRRPVRTTRLVGDPGLLRRFQRVGNALQDTGDHRPAGS